MFVGMNYIGKKWTSRQDFVSFNPSTEEELGAFPQSAEGEVDAAVDSAKKAQKSWQKLSRIDRGEYINKICHRLAEFAISQKLIRAISEETGKNTNESKAEITEALHMAQYTFGRSRTAIGDILPSEIAEKDCYLIKKPKGVVVAITPWNFPAAISFWCILPSLLEGNTVVWKPSEETPMVAQMVTELYDEAGFPEGVINLIHGDGDVGKMLVEHEDINHICFTGSYEVGKKIRLACAEHGKKTCSCEMGSKSAVIVCSDADMTQAVQACVASAYKLSGQRCVSAGRIIVDYKIVNEFMAKFIEASKAIRVGNPLLAEPMDIGPLISKAQRDRVIKYNYEASSDSHTQVLLPGYQTGNKGFFLTPHVYVTKWQNDEARFFLKQEVFGPHVAILPVCDIEEAINVYNDTNYALSLAVCTNDYRKMRKVRDDCDFGLGYVNLPCIGAESGAPFGGYKHSGYGGSSAAGTFDNVVHKVTWTVNNATEIKMAQGLKL